MLHLLSFAKTYAYRTDSIRYIASAAVMTGFALSANLGFAACTITSDMTATKADNIYISDTVNGTVTDVQTGLMWKLCNEGLSGSTCATGTATTFNWLNALSLTPATFASKTDWRLPSVNELNSLVDRGCSAAPLINVTKFPATTSAQYWTSTPAVENGIGKSTTNTTSGPAQAFAVDLSTGENVTVNKSTALRVRLVRNIP